MNPSNYISDRWFWGTLLTLMLPWVCYLYATDPGPRPTERIEDAEPQPAPPERRTP